MLRRNISQRGIDDLLEENGRDSTAMDINKDIYLGNNTENEIKELIESNDQLYSEEDDKASWLE